MLKFIHEITTFQRYNTVQLQYLFNTLEELKIVIEKNEKRSLMAGEKWRKEQHLEAWGRPAVELQTLQLSHL